MMIMKFTQLLFTLTLLLWQSWITTHMIMNYLLSLKLSRFGDTMWKVRPIPSTLLWIIKTLSIFLLLRYWPRGKHSGSSTSLSSILLSGSTLVILAQNWMLSLDNGISILKREILATPQSTLITSNLSLLKNNLQPPYELPSFFSLLSAQLQLWIWTSYIKNILSALPSDLIATKHISTDDWWSMDLNGLLLLNNRIYVLSAGNLCTRVL